MSEEYNNISRCWIREANMVPTKDLHEEETEHLYEIWC